MCNMKGSASAPNSATMNGTRRAIRPEMNATSRDRRHSFATSIEQLRAVVRPDAIAQVVKQFDDGEGSRRAGERVMASITRFLTERLRLTVNAAKSAVDRPWNRSFLGYTVTAHLQPRLRVVPRSIERLRDKLRAAIRQGRGRSMAHTIKDLIPILRGWIAYFRLAQVKGTFEDLDGWLRRKMRCILWRQWKRPRTSLGNH
jgi:hypothetical protein